ncbi:hypothetical protein [Haloactinomyces albus]|uniref:Uncharacterized protein n=1 Tax=Haloactinomyces albus TaxID=1352928 RepID=A0AAE3Z9Z9_9ACTN|nr:hypothetical protein [Haloactinomyces albus]MDR7301052.1 hypothetical protein [Haloactinomyces albus]
MIPAVSAATVALPIVAIALATTWTYAPRPQHADSGAGALTVAQLLAQSREQDRTERILIIPPETPEVPIAWPTTDPDIKAPGRPYLPGTTSQATPEFDAPNLDTLHRVLDGLQRL